jgi:hypothetical protein
MYTPQGATASTSGTCTMPRSYDARLIPSLLSRPLCAGGRPAHERSKAPGPDEDAVAILGAPVAALVVLIALKTAYDLRLHLREHRGLAAIES